MKLKYDLSDPDEMANTLQDVLVLDDADEEAMEVSSPSEEESRGIIPNDPSGSIGISNS